MQANNDEELRFDEDESENEDGGGDGDGNDGEAQPGGNAWPILIVDDEEQVHQATRYALGGALLLGRRLEFVSAYSAQQARKILREGRQFACILLDVVMESEDAGLALVSYIRETIADPRVRIVLRTGQPGYAPEVQVIQKYDINDYKCKSELTRNRLVTTMTAALRSYQQLCAIEANRHGLELIIDAASQLFSIRAVTLFAKGVLMQICAMLQIKVDGVLCVRHAGKDPSDLRILAASGRHADLYDHPLRDIHDPGITADIVRALQLRASFFAADRAVLYIVSPYGEELVVHIVTDHPLDELDQRLLKVFSINIAVGYDNALLFEQIEHLAFTDTLTGLPNRIAFEKEIERQVKLQRPFAVVLADIDNFQAVNDGLGHAIGNLTLQAARDVVRTHFGPQCFIARVSSDSFGIILPVGDPPGLHHLLSGFGKSQRTLHIEGNEIPLAMTVGAATYPEHGDNADRLFQNAGIALKHAKRASRPSYRMFDQQFETELLHRLLIAKDLRRAVELDQLQLFYQLQIGLDDRRVRGVEALLRWQRHDGALLAPNHFIPAAEESGHIIAIGEWVLREACLQQLRWKRENGQDLLMAVNVSIRQFRDPGFLDLLRSVVRETAIDPGKLEIEVTESMMVSDTQALIHTLQQIRAMGLRIAIDDFGTGYSSLSYLQKLPVDRLKIDRAFITGLTTHEEDRVIAALITQMGHQLGLQVIAEGVETPDHERMLRELQCDQVQGFLYSKALPPDELTEKIVAWNAPPPGASANTT